MCATCLGLLAALAAPSALSAPGAKDSAGREVEEWIHQLGDKRFAVREAATQQLLQRKDAVPALRAALQSPNAEVVRRAGLILEKLGQGPGQRALARLKEHGKNREVDLAVELLVRRPRWDNEHACWQVLTSLAADLFLSGTQIHSVKLNPDKHRGLVVRGTDIDLRTSNVRRAGLIAAAGSFRSPRGLLERSVIYAGGPAEVGMVRRSVLVCDGDLRVEFGTVCSLIIVRGDIYCPRLASLSSSLIIASGRLHFDHKGMPEEKPAKVHEQRPDLLGFVQFFDPAREGVEVEAAKGGVRVKAAAPDKPFARAGLTAGDLIVAVNGQPAESPEVFRRLLRRTFVTEESTLLRVERNGQPLELRVPGRP